MTEKANRWLIQRRVLETKQEQNLPLKNGMCSHTDYHAGLNETPKGGCEQAPLSTRRTTVPLPSSNTIHLQTIVAAVQPLSCVRLFVTPWTKACQVSLSFTISRNVSKLISIESVMPFNHLILCHPLLLLPSIFPSIRVYSTELALPIRRTKFWSFSFSISPSNEHSGLISFRIGLILQSKGLSRVFNTTVQLDRLRNPHPHLRLRQDSLAVACRFSCSLAGGIFVP